LTKHIIRSQQFDRAQLEALFRTADRMRRAFENPDPRAAQWAQDELRKRLTGKLMYAFFFEESTRTRFSFCTAGMNLGMNVVWTENAKVFSSASPVKKESLEHCIEVLCRYRPHVIVMRHDEEGASERAVAVVERIGAPVSIINAGDGVGQHPTQAILDLYTIQRVRGSIDGATVVIGGDLLHGRTVRSLAYLLAKFDGTRVLFTSPAELKPRADITDYLDRHNVPWGWSSDIETVLPEANVVYWTRLQTERIKDERLKARMMKLQSEEFRIGLPQMALMRHDAMLLHPLPINSQTLEILPEVESDPRAHFLSTQVDSGLYTRMAGLLDVCE
jgi:aspartate carbamoyltransferase catalytic subunit